MPLVAVAGAVVAGIEIASVGIAAMSAFEVVAAVGAIASGIGVVTGNQDLAQLGGVAALAGGVGMFAQSQGWFGASGELAAGQVEGATGNFARMDRAQSSTSDMINAATPGVAPANPSELVAADTAKGLAGDAAAGVTDPAAPAAWEPAAASNIRNERTGLINATGNAPTTGDFARMDRSATATSQSIFDTLKQAGAFMKDNKELSSMGLNFIGGLFDEKKKNEAKAADALSGLYDARAATERQQLANGNAVPDLTGLRVNPVNVFAPKTAPVYQAPRVGLINATAR